LDAEKTLIDCLLESKLLEAFKKGLEAAFYWTEEGKNGFDLTCSIVFCFYCSTLTVSLGLLWLNKLGVDWMSLCFFTSEIDSGADVYFGFSKIEL
jgi:hypothetical protein